ncbi:MAG: S8 family serine peptidase [Bacteroidales bacterium]|jgi:subtilisin family serine protease|nr:S8 family serine peptidase [Bacteroidales bacterium]
MKKFLFLFLIIISFNGYSQDFPKIETELQAQMQLMDNEDLVKINVIMKDQYDQLQLRKKADVFLSKENKRSFVISELKKYSKETQNRVIEYLDHSSKSDNVKEITSHWLYNGVNCYATKNVIEELATLDEVLVIGYDVERNMLFDNENPKPAEAGSKELTYNVTKVRANEVWGDGFTGEGIIVSVIDTGVNYNHEDIKDQMWQSAEYPLHGYNFYSNTNNPMDNNGHGTHCAGTVAGNGASGSQTGMAPDATIMAIKVLNSQGGGAVSGAVSGVEFSVENGAHILSMSLGWVTGALSVAERIMFRTTMVNTLEAGVVASVAAGNEGGMLSSYPIPNNVRTPGNCPPPWNHPDQTLEGGKTCVVCVGATDSNDAIANFSSLGPVTWQSYAGFNDYPYIPGMGLIRPDVCAPGVNIKSLTHDSNTGYALNSGTSMAAPGVAGVMALMMSKNIELTPAEIDSIIETTAVKLSPSKNNTFGSGRIDAYEAMLAIKTGLLDVQNVIVDDSQGNNNGNMNPGETISLDLSLINKDNVGINNVNATIIPLSEYVTIINDYAEFGNFSPNEIKTVNGAYTFSLSPNTPANEEIKFTLLIKSNDDVFYNQIVIITYDYKFDFVNTSIDDAAGNNNNLLDPGETVNMTVTIINSGLEDAYNITGLLSSPIADITINTNTANFGNILIDQSKSGSYSITLSSSAVSGSINIPFYLLLTDENGKESNLSFTYMDKCKTVFDLSTHNNSWNGAAIIVSFDDGTPSRTLTVNTGTSAIHKLDIASGTTVSLTWQSGGADALCFYDIYYEYGDYIYSGSGNPGSGIFFSWLNDCQGNNYVCNPVQNLNIGINNTTAYLTWDPPFVGTPVSYQIYKNSGFAGSTTNTSYSVSIGNTASTLHVYAIYDDCISIPISKTVSAQAGCESISNLVCEIGYNNTINASWTAPLDVTNLVGYKVYVDGIYIETITDLSYSYESQPGDVRFCVAALYNISEGINCESDKVCEDVNVIDFCEPVTNLIASLNGNTVILNWTAPELVEFVENYNIYRDGILIGTSTTNNFSNEINENVYEYAVEVVYENSCISAQISVNIDAIPYNLIATAISNSKIQLEWQCDNNNVSFNIYRDGSAIVSNITDKQHVDAGLDGESEYCYIIRAHNGGSEFSESNESCATTFAGIEDYNGDLKVYPNPSNSIINIEGENMKEIVVLNSVGQIVKLISVDTDKISVDVSKFNSGNYIFKVSYNDNKIENIKVVVNK